jgi:hypothetical protein
MPRSEYIELVANQTRKPARMGAWSSEFPEMKLGDYQQMNAD